MGKITCEQLELRLHRLDESINETERVGLPTDRLPLLYIERAELWRSIAQTYPGGSDAALASITAAQQDERRASRLRYERRES